MDISSFGAELSDEPVQPFLVAFTDAEITDALVNRDLLPDLEVARRYGGFVSDVTSFLSLSGGDHRAARKAVSPFFNERATSHFDGELRRIAREQAAHLAEGTATDIHADYSRPFAAHAVISYLGLSTANLDVDSAATSIAGWARDVLDTRARARRRILALASLYNLVRCTIDAHEVGSISAGGAIQGLCDVGVDPSVVRGVAMPMVVVGVELAARGVSALIADRAAKRGPASLIDVDRVLAAEGIVPSIDRISSCPVSLGVGRVPADARVRVTLTVNEEGVGPSTPRPFGLGDRFCLGAAWVRHVMLAGATEVLARFPTLAVLDLERASFQGPLRGIVSLSAQLSSG